MFPVIDKKKTGINLRKIMDERGLAVKDIQQYLGLSNVQSIYHWLNGLSMPTIDHLYALSELFRIPVDDMLHGNRQLCVRNEEKWLQCRRICVYYEKLGGYRIA